MAFARDVVDAAFLLDEPTQHGVEIGIFRQGVLVLLVRPQLGGWRLAHDPRRHHLAGGTQRPFRDTAVPPRGQRVDVGLVLILQHRIAAAHVAVERGVAHRHLGLVAGRQQHRTELVGDGHQQEAAHARLDVLLGDVALAAGEQRLQHALDRVDRSGDWNRLEPDAEPGGRQLGVNLALVAGEARRQAHGHHAVAAERVDCDACRHGGIDAARKAEQHAGKAVLVDVVAKANHQRVIRVAGLARHRRELTGRTAPAVRLALPSRRRRRLVPDRQSNRDGVVGVDDKRAAVEHELVLSAHLVHVHQRQTGFAAALQGERHAMIELGTLERRSVRHDQHPRPAVGQAARHGRVPHVLADHDAKPHASEIDRIGQRPGAEEPLLVKHAVVRQLVLVADGVDPAAGHEDGGVIESAFVGPGRGRQDGRAVYGLGRQIVNSPPGRRHNGGPQDQIFRRVANQGELAADEKIGVAGGRTRLADPGQVALNIANSRVELRDGD